MTEALAIPLSVLLESLIALARERLVVPSPEASFAASLVGTGALGIASAEGARDVQALERGESPVLAVTGFQLWSDPGRVGAPTLAGWKSGMTRLSKRDPFPADRQTFALRLYELIGIAAGAHAIATHADWMRDVVRRLGDEALTTRQRLGAGLAGSLLNISLPQPMAIDPAKADLSDLALALWSVSRFEVAIRFDGVASAADAGRIMLKRSLVEPLGQIGGADALVLAGELRAMTLSEVDRLADSPGAVSLRTHAAVRIVLEICRRLDVVVRALGQRHDRRPTLTITDEYDVQDLLHCLLLTRFEDVRPEECTPSYAGRSARTDFLLYREEVFVEAKKTRAGLRDREVAEQLSADVAFYKRHPRCRALVCVVYDPDHLLRNPAALESDLSGMHEGVPVAVVVCPKGL